mmetsp:Transcript_19273/g.60497  ORF Transcript_19273/g.60497 Transcript_19273/m.60497 type:complete len:257 (+) Transcript_19273:399-1169(+)
MQTCRWHCCWSTDARRPTTRGWPTSCATAAWTRGATVSHLSSLTAASKRSQRRCATGSSLRQSGAWARRQHLLGCPSLWRSCPLLCSVTRARAARRHWPLRYCEPLSARAAQSWCRAHRPCCSRLRSWTSSAVAVEPWHPRWPSRRWPRSLVRMSCTCLQASRAESRSSRASWPRARAPSSRLAPAAPGARCRPQGTPWSRCSTWPWTTRRRGRAPVLGRRATCCSARGRRRAPGREACGGSVPSSSSLGRPRPGG